MRARRDCDCAPFCDRTRKRGGGGWESPGKIFESWEIIRFQEFRQASESRHMLVVCIALFERGGGGCGGHLNVPPL